MLSSRAAEATSARVSYRLVMANDASEGVWELCLRSTWNNRDLGRPSAGRQELWTGRWSTRSPAANRDPTSRCPCLNSPRKPRSSTVVFHVARSIKKLPMPWRRCGVQAPSGLRRRRRPKNELTTPETSSETETQSMHSLNSTVLRSELVRAARSATARLLCLRIAAGLRNLECQSEAIP